MSFSVKAKEFVPSPMTGLWTGGHGGVAATGAAAESSSTSSVYSGGGGAGAVSSSALPRSKHQPPQPQQREHLKERVCMAFYECGECPFSDSCAHAHHFTELSTDAQATLLMTVSVESIPAHFLSPTTSPGATAARRDKGPDVSNSSASVSGVLPGFTPYARFTNARAPPNATVAAAGGGGGVGSAGASRRHSSLPSSVNSSSPRGRACGGNDESSGLAALGPSAFDAASTSSRGSSSHHHLSPKPGSPVMSLEGFKMRLPTRCRYPHNGMPGTYYSFLGVSRTATQEEIIAKYRLWQREAFRRMRAVDPVGAEAADRIIVEARNVLGNPGLRAEYDESLAAAANAAAAITQVHVGCGVPAAAVVGGSKWAASALALPQSANPGSAWNVNNVSSSAGTSISQNGRRHIHGHSLSSSASSAGSVNGSGSGPHVANRPSSDDSLQGRLSPIPALSTDMFAGGIW